jgi:hypothetical protein
VRADSDRLLDILEAIAAIQEHAQTREQMVANISAVRRMFRIAELVRAKKPVV